MNYLIKFFSFSFIFISYFILCANEILTKDKAQKNINFNLKSKIENFSKNSINFDFAKFAFFLKGRNDKILYDEVNELFPHTKNIILSSNTIPNYSKGETLYFSFETKKEIETKISSRIVNIIDNKGITNIEMYHEYYTIIGGNININQECFNIDNTIYDSSSKNLMISAYSFYGINITLYNDQEIIETKIITNWNYIIINPQITKSICYFPISSNSLSGVFFQLIDYKTLDKNQNQIKISDSLLKKIFYKKRIISDDELEETEEENPEIEDKFEEETENEEETEDDIEEIEDDIEEIEDDIEETEDEKETKYEFEEEEDENIEREIEIEEIEDDIAEEEEMEDQNNELEEQIIDSEEKIEYESLIEDENEPDENEEFEDENEEQNNGNYPISYNPMNDIIFSFPKDKEDKKNYGWVIGVVIGVVVVAVGVVLFVFRKKICVKKSRKEYQQARDTTVGSTEKMKNNELEI